MKKVLLIGDSIRLGYDKYIKMAFEGKAEVVYPGSNCMFTGVVIRSLADWADGCGVGKDLDLIHWNAGLWDDLIMLDGKRLTAPEVYVENIGRICDLIGILFPNAKMIFATSTPVREELFGRLKRYNKDTELYNRLACDIVKSRGGFIDDLYTHMSGVPDSFYSDMTHFYTREGTERITAKVAESIGGVLGIEPVLPDFDLIYGKKEVSGDTGF